MNTLDVYLLDVAERAGKTAVEAALLNIGAVNLLHLNAFAVDWATAGEYALGGAILSILISLASAPATNNGTASLIKQVKAIVAPKPADSYILPSEAFSAPSPTTTKASNIMAPIADDGTTEYETYPGTPQTVADNEKAAAAAPASGDPASIGAAPVDEPVTENEDGSVTINGVTYWPHDAAVTPEQQ